MKETTKQECVDLNEVRSLGNLTLSPDLYLEGLRSESEDEKNKEMLKMLNNLFNIVIDDKIDQFDGKKEKSLFNLEFNVEKIDRCNKIITLNFTISEKQRFIRFEESSYGMLTLNKRYKMLAYNVNEGDLTTAKEMVKQSQTPKPKQAARTR